MKRSKIHRLLVYTLWCLFVCIIAFVVGWIFNIQKMILPLVVAFTVSFIYAFYAIWWKNENPTFGITHYLMKKNKQKNDVK
mgnify:CR=1 FL=1